MYNDDGKNITSLMIKEISKTHVLTKKEEYNLFDEYNKITNTARKDEIKTIILNSNMRFVLQVAIYYNKMTGVNLNDLVSEGKLGLVKAFNEFDYTRNVKFISSAVWHIRCMITKFLAEDDLIRLPTHIKIKLNKLKQKIKNKKDINLTLKTEFLLEENSIPITLDQQIPTGNEDGLLLSDVIKDETAEDPKKASYQNDIKKEIKTILETILTEDERKIIEGLFGLNDCYYTIKEISELMNLSKDNVKKIKKNALKKLKKYSNMKILNKYMFNYC